MKISKFISFLAGLYCLGASDFLHAESFLKRNDRVAIIGNTFADQLRNHGYLETLLVKDLGVTVKHLAWGGDSVTQRDRPTNFPDEKGRLLEHKTDVIIACFGMGESFEGKEGVELFKTDLAKLLKSYQGQRYNGESAVKIVLVSPIAYEDHGYTTPNLVSRNEDLALYSEAMKEVAGKLEVGFIDLYQPTKKLYARLKETKLTNNGIHLNSVGYWALSGEVYEQLTGARNASSSLMIDAENLDAKASGLEFLNLNKEDGKITFQVGGKTRWYQKSPNSHQSTAEIRGMKSDKIQINKLTPGSHTLSIDGKEVVTATAVEWAKGVILDHTARHDALDKLRLDINNKNLQFTYSWKALNQVHIVGERKTSQSGRSLPKEVLEFDKISKAIQQKVVMGSAEGASEWSIAPARSEQRHE